MNLKDIIRCYGLYGTIKLSIYWVHTKLLFPRARLVRFPIQIRGRQNIKYGRNLTTGINLRLDAFSKNDQKIILTVGENCQVNDFVHIAAIEKIEIGNNVLIASHVFISDHNHGVYHEKNIGSVPEVIPSNRPLCSRPILIGSNVWIGEHVSILPGVSIGYGAVIGANSVVTRNIPPNSIAVGNPARVIRTFDKETLTWKRRK